jgi:muramoyltetrapeptide carboxypeptidase
VIKPKRLTAGSTLGIVAPASPFDVQKLAQGRTLLESVGFRTVLAANVDMKAGYLAGGDLQRAAQLMDMLTTPDVDAVICARGGYGSMRMMPHLDWRTIGRLGKPLIGFSDISALLQTMLAWTATSAFHGPMVCSLSESDPDSLLALQQALTADQPLRLTADRPVVLKAGQARGALVGGNLTTLCHLVGTPYSVRYEKCILFIEDIGEAPYRIDRMLLQMQMAGCFDGLAGVALGSFDGCGDENQIFEIVVERFANQQIPILAGFGMGHGPRNLTWPIGGACRMDTRSGHIDLIECATALKGGPHDGAV